MHRMALAHLQAIFACLPCSTAPNPTTTYPSEKTSLTSAYAPANADANARPAAEIAQDVTGLLLHTSLEGPALRMRLDSMVGSTGWRENVARWVLEKLSLALQKSEGKLGPTVHNAYNRAWDVARGIEGFVVEHPVMCTVIAFGVLAIVAPWILELLGFADLGPVEGSFAARWQSTYAGLVPKGSLFSFFQRLGMRNWHWKILV
ncbi:hypothetical protein DDE82_004588 [Stemphylium lycopersici]|uniref:Lincomycin-condensing protein lmbA n=1 Tax=Stemphylium lycopersici TaxID=183478 RepID=A0A364N347_STELY|nr:hypothetical protein TW65_02951 [Stemphylium lycopersici]RAR04383.1 hypothetical protein DDE82_004588 [Stemphylium lycopersici]RAR10782.1 hypothetical protein DDE83_004926 [Stemphylium lycopersici]